MPKIFFSENSLQCRSELKSIFMILLSEIYAAWFMITAGKWSVLWFHRFEPRRQQKLSSLPDIRWLRCASCFVCWWGDEYDDFYWFHLLAQFARQTPGDGIINNNSTSSELKLLIIHVFCSAAAAPSERGFLHGSHSWIFDWLHFNLNSFLHHLMSYTRHIRRTLREWRKNKWSSSRNHHKSPFLT